MADAITNIDLGELHTAIRDKIALAFPTLKTVEFYREEVERRAPEKSELPACLLELSELEPDPEIDPGTEQLAVIARFEARVIIGFKTAQAKIEIRKLAAALAAWMHKNRHFHGKPTGSLTVDGIVPDTFEPNLDQYEVWRVDFSMPVHLGETVWTDEGLTPVEVWTRWPRWQPITSPDGGWLLNGTYTLAGDGRTLIYRNPNL